MPERTLFLQEATPHLLSPSWSKGVDYNIISPDSFINLVLLKLSVVWPPSRPLCVCVHRCVTLHTHVEMMTRVRVIHTASDSFPSPPFRLSSLQRCRPRVLSLAQSLRSYNQVPVLLTSLSVSLDVRNADLDERTEQAMDFSRWMGLQRHERVFAGCVG